MPATVLPLARPMKEWWMSTVMIGIDPHKGSHTAVAIDRTEELDRTRFGGHPA